MWKSVDQDDDRASGEERLVAGLRRRTPDAFAGLHDQYASGIYNLALRMVRHASDAEDITQDVLIRAYERVPQDREVLLRPWLYRLTLNRCYDHLRAAARRPASHLAAPDLPSMHDPFEHSELQARIEAALGDLTRRQRSALLLKDVHGLSLVEVAACLELTPGSVEVLLARARRAFRASFEARCLAEGHAAPRSGGALATLPALALYPLPPALAAPLPPAILPALPAGLPPIAAAAGGGIGAAFGLPVSFKTAALIIAAAATVGTAEVAATHGSARHRVESPVAATLVAGAAPIVSHKGAGRTASPRPEATASAHGVKAVPSATPSVAELPSPSASPVDRPTPSPTETPLGIPSVTPTPVETPSASPSAHVTTPASPTATPSPAESLTPSPGSSPTL